MKVIVFDLGKTLMQYVGMPHLWVDYYQQGFEAIIREYNCKVSDGDVKKSIQILTDFNPRVNYREVEFSALYIFSQTLKHWNLNIPIQKCVEIFWSGLKLKAEIYSDTITVLKKLKEKGYVTATLTDLPNAMPDDFFKKDIYELLSFFDFYVSSEVAGYRKPNSKGLQMIADKFGVLISQLIFVGDEEKDRQTAQNAGCDFIQINRTEKNSQCIGNLYELLGLL